MKTKETKGWGIRVGGPNPYLAGEFYWHKEECEEHLEESYHRPVKVVLIPIAEWRRLKSS